MEEENFVPRVYNFINGEFYETEKTAHSIDPATLKPIADIPKSDSDDCDKAVKAAKNAFESWSETSVEERAAFMFKIADLIMENLDMLALTESMDQGKPVHLAKLIDIPRSAQNFRFFAETILHHNIDKINHMKKMGKDYTSYSHGIPVGVAGLISAWNLPLYILTWKIAPAIAFGNTCVCKPAMLTSLTAFELCKIIKKSGLPNGVVNILFGSGAVVGEAIVKHPDVPLISFTGSTGVGARIMGQVAPLIKKSAMELGGKNASVVFEDCDIDKAVQGIARSAFTNQGEICLCTERTYVHEDIYDEFVEKLILETAKYTVGDPRDSNSRLGAMCGKTHYEKVKEYFEHGLKNGYNVAGYGKTVLNLPEHCKNGYFLPPTVMTNVPADDIINMEEIFGPITTVAKFSTEAEGIKMANDSIYGLSATIWTENISRANRVAKKIQAGTIWINCWLVRDLTMPFGGMKQSGTGRESATDSAEFFTEQQTICTSW